ncbi:MAG: hypothetical protein EOO16_13080 [Chitinophagaceae bacterium]|nr:MAG: hypothetical protein EOO16_13080 [Chitinophagaceae bacterium]
MKPFLMLLGLVAALGAQAQNKKVDSLQRLLREKLASKYQRMPNAWGRTTPFAYHDYSIKGGRKGMPHLLPPSTPGVHNLPIDGMHCIVPDTSSIAAIPNAFASPKVPYNTSQNIPNPMDRAVPQKR